MDWAVIVLECRRYGLRAAARELGINHQTLRYCESGGEPSHSLGQSLIGWWMLRTGKSVGELPVLDGAGRSVHWEVFYPVARL